MFPRVQPVKRGAAIAAVAGTVLGVAPGGLGQPTGSASKVMDTSPLPAR
jgi:hypothetical protein